MLQGHESPVDMRSAVADALLAPPVAAGVPQAQPIALEPTDFDAPKKRGRGMLLPIVLGGGLGLLAVGLAVWWLFDSGDTEPDAHAAAGADAAAASASATADTAPVLAATPDAAETAPPSPSAAEPEVEAPPTDALVKFACNPACDQIKCDGKKVAAPSEGIRLSPGRHTCVGSKAGYLPAKESFQVKAGEDLKRDLRLSKIRYAPPPPKPARTCGTFLNPCK